MIERLALYAMGTRFEMALAGASSTALRAAGEAALDTVRELHQLWSAFDPGSLLTRVNRLAAGRPVPVDGETFSILLLARELWEATDGRFDPTIGEKMRMGGFRGDRPRRSGVEGAPGMDAVELDEEASTVWFRDPQIELDLGAIAKGVALDRAALSLREAEVPCALLHGGTSSVIAIGAPPDSEGWPIALDDEGELPRVHLRDAALAVSAGWGRVVEEESRVHGHLLDPRSGDSVSVEQWAAVVDRSAAQTDAWATALVAGPPGELAPPATASILEGSKRGEITRRLDPRGVFQ